MDEYFIGAGALLKAGPAASIASATLHAQPQSGLSGQVEVALIDFEATRLDEVSRILIVASGWSCGRFRTEVVRRLLAQRDCTLADVIATLAEGTGTQKVHIFAHWRLDDATIALLAKQGIEACPHPLEAIGHAALVCGQRRERWRSAGCAA